MAAPTRAETVVLVGGGRIQGEVLEQPEASETLMLRTASGATIGIPRVQVAEVIPASADERQYRALLAETPDTLDGHLRLAQWCDQHRLRQYRTAHLRAVLKYDPDHVEARRALGYRRRGERWMTEEQWMVSRGYVRYGHRWRLPQETGILEQKADQDAVTGQWHRNIQQWYEWATGRDAQRRAEGLQALRQIDDPAAMEPMQELLGMNTDVDTRLLFLEYLARVGNAQAIDRLVLHSMNDLSMEVRSAGLLHLIEHFPKEAGERYERALTYFEREVMITAAAYLGALQDPAAVAPLIDVLETTHPVTPPLEELAPDGLLYRLKLVHVPPRDPAAIHPIMHELVPRRIRPRLSMEVLPRGWLRSMRRKEKEIFALSPRDIYDAISGTGPKVMRLPSVLGQASGRTTKDYPNRQVRETLMKLTGQDFGFDEAAWLEWLGHELDSRYRPLLDRP